MGGDVNVEHEEEEGDIIMKDANNTNKRRPEEDLTNETNKRHQAAEGLLKMQIPIQANSTSTSLSNNTSTSNNLNKENRFWNPPNLTEYPSSISGPYKIIIQPINQTNSQTEKKSKLYAIDIAKIIIPKFPQKVFEEIKQTGFNKVMVITYNRGAANSLLKLDCLKEKNLRAFIPSSFIYKKCIINGVPDDINIEDEATWKEQLELVSPVSRLQIVNVRRFRRKINPNDGNIPTVDNTVPLRTILVTYVGQVIPQYAYLMQVRFKTYHYLPKVKLCSQCYRYNHVASNCKSGPRCIICGNKDHEKNSCPIEGNDIVCINCQGNHFPTDPNCNTRKIEQDIKNEAVKTNANPREVRKKYLAHDTKRKTFRWSEHPELSEETEDEDIIPSSQPPQHSKTRYRDAALRKKTLKTLKTPTCKSNSQIPISHTEKEFPAPRIHGIHPTQDKSSATQDSQNTHFTNSTYYKIAKKSPFQTPEEEEDDLIEYLKIKMNNNNFASKLYLFLNKLLNSNNHSNISQIDPKNTIISQSNPEDSGNLNISQMDSQNKNIVN